MGSGEEGTSGDGIQEGEGGERRGDYRGIIYAHMRESEELNRASRPRSQDSKRPEGGSQIMGEIRIGILAGSQKFGLVLIKRVRDARGGEPTQNGRGTNGNGREGGHGRAG